MGMDVVWEGPGGPIAQIGDPESLLARAFEGIIGNPSFPTLARVDLYHRTELPSGDGLVREITILRDREPDPGVRAHLSRVLDLARRAAQDPATILRFEGD